MARKLESFITSFIASTHPTAAPILWRRWIALTTLGAALKQNVFVRTTSNLYPNFYTIMVGHPGVGKTRCMNYARGLVTTADAAILAPTSVSFASLVDALTRAKVEIVRQPEGQIKYNSMLVLADELGAFMNKYDSEMMNGLQALYDTTPYSQERRTGDRKLRIDSPQLSILAGATPSFIVSFMPDGAWGQGFTSRTIMVFSDQRIDIDDFADHGKPMTEDLAHDLKEISQLYGRFTVHEQYRSAVNDWKSSGEPPVPGHPRLVHYNTRRRVHIYKLSMLASIDRGDDLTLTEPDFFTALEWLVSAERTMADIFKAGVTNADSQAMSDIIHWIKVTDFNGQGVSEQAIIRYAQPMIPLPSILRVIELLENSGQIYSVRQDKRTGVNYYRVVQQPEEN